MTIYWKIKPTKVVAKTTLFINKTPIKNNQSIINSKTFQIKTFGCKVNNYESQLIYQSLLTYNFFPATVKDGNLPDFIVVNTCSVTGIADKKAIKEIRRHTNLLVIVGCFMQSNTDYSWLPKKAIVLGTTNKHLVPKLVLMHFSKEIPEQYIHIDNPRNVTYHDQINNFLVSPQRQTRGFIKIQDGCDYNCSFCIIPRLRGMSRSKPIPVILNEIKHFLKNDCHEIVFTGINIGCYGEDLIPKTTIADLLMIVEKLYNDKDFRIRISSIEPNAISSSFFNFLTSSTKICSHLHIPLQSGSSAVLKQMKRKYQINEFISLIKKLKKIMPKISITTDIICGYGCETNDEFLKTIAVAQQLNFFDAHVFPYSIRKLTVGEFAKHCSIDIRRNRVRKLIAIINAQKLKYLEKVVNQKWKLVVLFESKKQLDNSYYYVGYSSEYFSCAINLTEINFSLQCGKLYTCIPMKIIGTTLVVRIC